MSVPPATQKPWTLQTTGLSEWNSDMNPRRFRDIIWKSATGSQVRPGSWLAATVAGSSGRPLPPSPGPPPNCSAAPRS